MMRFQITLILLLLFSCSQKRDNKLKDEQAIRELFSKTTTASFLEQSADKYVEARAENALSVPAGRDLLIGKEEILKFYERFFRNYDVGTLDDFAPDKFPIDELIISGDLAFARVTYSTIFASRTTSKTDTISSRHFYILQKLYDGHWKITHDTWNNIPFK